MTCLRRDGSGVISRPRPGAFFARHDLLHYAVETTLGFRQGFFGLIAAGRSIESFEAAGAASRVGPEALHAEHIVNMLAQEFAFNTRYCTDEFNRVLGAAVAQGRLPPPRALGQVELQRIRAAYTRLLAEYEQLAPRAELELAFPDP
jgi:hypothetical protein